MPLKGSVIDDREATLLFTFDKSLIIQTSYKMNKRISFIANSFPD